MNVLSAQSSSGPTDPATPVEALCNIGPVCARWLRGVGIATRGDLERVGPVFAYLLARHHHPEAGINTLLVYALHGALTGEAFSAIPPATRAQLREEAHAAKLVVHPATTDF